MRTFRTFRSFSSKQTGERVLPPQMNFNVSGMEKLRKNLTWGEWIITSDGRKVVCGVSVGLACSVSTALWFAQIIYPHVLQESYVEYKPDSVKLSILKKIDKEEGNVYPPAPELIKLYSKLWQRAGLTEEEHEAVEIFTSNLLDPVVIGTTHCKEGASVGIPRSMMWMTEDEVDLTSVRFKPNWNRFFQGYSIPDTADPADLEELRRNLILSPAAREFIVSKSMAKANDYQAWFVTVIPGVFIMLHYVFGVRFNEVMKLLEGKRFIRLGVQSLWMYVMIMIMIVFINLSNAGSEKESIEDVIRSVEQADGAIEYYTKCLNRNKMLRKLIGEDSHYYFLESGDLVPFFYEFLDMAGMEFQLKLVHYQRSKMEAIEKERIRLAD